MTEIHPADLQIGDVVCTKRGWSRVDQIGTELVSGFVGEPERQWWRIFAEDGAVVTVPENGMVIRADE